MKNISILIKPASSLCNLRCKYCFYANVSDLREVKCYGIMSIETSKKLIDNVFSELYDEDTINIGFQGGEPTMAGISFFKDFIEYVKTKNQNVQVNYFIQTNGTYINPEWCEFLRKNNFLVGLSLDGYDENHNLNRLNDKKMFTFNRVMSTKRMFDKFGVEYNVLTVLTERLSNHAKEVFDFLIKENIKYLQLIPCLDDLNVKKKGEHALTPKGFYKFYKELLPLWKNEFENGNYISIKLFDDIFNLFVNGQVNACGLAGSCSIQFVIESDGSVYPCDFYALDKYLLGNITKNKLSEMYSSSVAYEFINSRPISLLNEKCKSCKYFNMCRGGCKRMANSMYVDEKGFCGYESVLDIFVPNVENILRIFDSKYSKML
ncbi:MULTISPECIES: SPASM domain-containing protein [Helcococcus]|uniref:SPASM domain-containing protein n=1 Tax=Helcococcus bovis TaxID=3153252 RepID=A0ABW9F549_9FIRM